MSVAGPVTEAGKALLASVPDVGYRNGEFRPEWRTEDLRDVAKRIAAIEAEAVRDWLQSPEAEKALAAALHEHHDPGRSPTKQHMSGHQWDAKGILAALREAQ